MQLRHHSAVELVDRLEKKHLVRRERNLNDRRSVLVLLTARGERVLERLSVSHHAEIRTYGPMLAVSLDHLLHGSEKRPLRNEAAR